MIGAPVHSLFYWEVTGVTYLSSLLEGYSFRRGRRDLRVWSPNPLEGFSCKSLFSCLFDPFPLDELVFSVLWKIEILRKVNFFTWQVLLGQHDGSAC